MVKTKVAGMWTATFKVAAKFEWADNLHMGANKVIGCSVSWRDRGREVKNDLATSGYGNQDGELAFCNRRQKTKKNKKKCLISRLRTRGDVSHALADNTCRLKYIILPGVSAQTSHPGKRSVHVAQQQFSEMKTEIKPCASFCLPSVFLFYRLFNSSCWPCFPSFRWQRCAFSFSCWPASVSCRARVLVHEQHSPFQCFSLAMTIQPYNDHIYMYCSDLQRWEGHSPGWRGI